MERKGRNKGMKVGKKDWKVKQKTGKKKGKGMKGRKKEGNEGRDEEK